MIYRKFKIDKKVYSALSNEDKTLLRLLKEVVKDASLLYKLQLREGFYPKGITKQELEHAAKLNPEILSPFTYVERKNGELQAVSYYVRYSKYLKPIAKKIEKAAKFSENKLFKRYLLARAKSLLDGSYTKADIAWLNVKNSKLDFNIGPFERYLDKKLFIKRIFQAHVGMVNREYTRIAERYKEALYTSAKITDSKYHSTDIPKKGVHVFVEQCVVVAGYATDVLFSAECFPCDLDIALKHGSKILIYQSQLELKFDRLYYPIFKRIFERRFASKYPKELLLEASRWCALLYELGKQLHKFEGARGRLQELYGSIDEANGFASGIQHCKHLVVKGLISEDLLEAIIIIHILWLFADWLLYLNNKHKESHVIGNSILLNSYLANGALKESEGISWPNFSRIFFTIESLADSFAFLLQKGTYKETEQFIKKNAGLENFEKLGKNLKSLPAKL